MIVLCLLFFTSVFTQILECEDKLNLILVLDESGSVGEEDFDAFVKPFALEVLGSGTTDYFRIENDYANVGVLKFTTKWQNEPYHTEYCPFHVEPDIMEVSDLSGNQAGVISSITSATYRGGSSPTGHALLAAYEMIQRHSDRDALSFIFLVSDGRPACDLRVNTTEGNVEIETAYFAIETASDIKNNGILIFVIEIGDQLTSSVTSSLASRNSTGGKYVFNAETKDLAGISAMIEKIYENSCNFEIFCTSECPKTQYCKLPEFCADCDPACKEKEKCGPDNTCICDDGYFDPGDGSCIPECIPSCGLNANCTSPDECSCLPGYELGWVNDPHIRCIKICPGQCGLFAECSDEMSCICRDGYEPGDPDIECFPTCTGGCGINAGCTSPENCTCDDDFKPGDPDIECFPICIPPECDDHSTCDAPYTCVCENGYYYPDGENICHPSCNPQCGSNAICSEPNVCICDVGFYGDPKIECIPKCLPLCGVNANCIGDLDTTWCECPNDYYGQPLVECFPICNETCGINAHCSEPYTCGCDQGYSPGDPNVECLPDCFTNLDGCPQNSHCESPNYCVCNAAFDAVDDQVYDTSLECIATCTPECGNNAVCSGPNNCTCEFGYLGDPIEGCEKECFPQCIENAECIDEFCFCKDGYFGDVSDECYPICESGYCGKNAYCSEPGVCECDEGYGGNPVAPAQCTPVCDPECGLNATCFLPDDCRCPEGMTGDPMVSCLLWCPNGCVENAYCCNVGECCCNDDYTGDSNSECRPSCHSKVFFEACSYDNSEGNGTCVEPDVCECEKGYFGTECELWDCFKDQMDDVDIVCGGHGSCIKPDLCLCEDDFSGIKCKVNNIDPFENMYSPTTTSVIVGLGIGLLALCCCIMCLLCCIGLCLKKKSRKYFERVVLRDKDTEFEERTDIEMTRRNDGKKMEKNLEDEVNKIVEEEEEKIDKKKQKMDEEKHDNEKEEETDEETEDGERGNEKSETDEDNEETDESEDEGKMKNEKEKPVEKLEENSETDEDEETDDEKDEDENTSNKETLDLKPVKNKIPTTVERVSNKETLNLKPTNKKIPTIVEGISIDTPEKIVLGEKLDPLKERKLGGLKPLQSISEVRKPIPPPSNFLNIDHKKEEIISFKSSNDLKIVFSEDDMLEGMNGIGKEENEKVNKDEKVVLGSSEQIFGDFTSKKRENEETIEKEDDNTINYLDDEMFSNLEKDLTDGGLGSMDGFGKSESYNELGIKLELEKKKDVVEKNEFDLDGFETNFETPREITEMEEENNVDKKNFNDEEFDKLDEDIDDILNFGI